jgi:hypothetical protein
MDSGGGGGSSEGANDRDVAFADALAAVHGDVRRCMLFENALKGKGPLKDGRRALRSGAHTRVQRAVAAEAPPPPPPQPPAVTRDAETALAITEEVLARARRLRQVASNESAEEAAQHRSPECLALLSRYTDHVALRAYEPFLHYVPRIVNAVTLAEAVPIEGSGVTLPLDLHFIASRCRNAFYAPRKFSAVQLAYSSPRARVLVFHTGRLVGTGARTLRHAPVRSGARVWP